MKKFNKLKYWFLRIRGAFCRHRFFYEWGVSGVDRHGLYCVKCTMRVQSIPGRRLRFYDFEMPDKSEMSDDGSTSQWTNPRKIK